MVKSTLYLYLMQRRSRLRIVIPTSPQHSDIIFNNVIITNTIQNRSKQHSINTHNRIATVIFCICRIKTTYCSIVMYNITCGMVRYVMPCHIVHQLVCIIYLNGTLDGKEGLVNESVAYGKNTCAIHK